MGYMHSRIWNLPYLTFAEDSMLASEQIMAFRRDGYLVVEDLISPAVRHAVVAEYTDLMDRLYAEWRQRGQVPELAPDATFWDKLDVAVQAKIEWYQPFDISLPADGITAETPMHFGPAVFDMITSDRILNTVECLIGSEITSNPIQHVRIKPPERDVQHGETRAHIVSTDWHQDRAVTLEAADETEMVTVWLAITDATVENGCLQVKPGRTTGMIPHCALTQLGIREKFLPKQDAVPAPVKAGGGVIFHPLTPHASLRNLSNEYRWSFDLRYNVTGQNTGRDHFPDFVARSRTNPSAELRDWQVWKDMWEATRADIAQSKHINQHGRWSADGPYCA
jgi:ectoine hydroxylase-related dioxygenase (phytanoyl-CoA dioxygenase family)